MLEDLRGPYTDELPAIIEWDLYEFFRAPGVYYYSDHDKDKIRYYGADPSMMTHMYGYRLGTPEEVHELKNSNQKEE
jgi:hypothetical protein